MIKFGRIFVALLLLSVSCSEYDEDMVEDQREDIVSFLTTKHSPLLVSQSDAEESLDDEVEFYSTTGYVVYRYVEDYYNSERLSRPELSEGDQITITFWCYDFSSFATPSDSSLYYTNDPTYQSVLEDAGLNTQYWSFEPKSVTLGSGDILKSIETALVGCREGDSVELYLTYNMAYGSEWVGTSTLDSPIAFFCTIESVEN